jgi:hypothetical protein
MSAHCGRGREVERRLGDKERERELEKREKPKGNENEKRSSEDPLVALDEEGDKPVEGRGRGRTRSQNADHSPAQNNLAYSWLFAFLHDHTFVA